MRFSARKLGVIAGNVILFAFVAISGFYIYRTRVGLIQGKYTIGYLTGSSLTVSSGWTLEYDFMVNEVVYKGSRWEDDNMNTKIGARYLVRYDSTAPKWHQIYYEDPIPDSIRRVPANGWRWRPWPDPAHPELSPPSRPARDSAEAAMWREMAATKASADSLTARNQRE